MAVLPYLYYENVENAMRFLAKAFGFRRFGAQNRDKEGRVFHAAMRSGDDVIMMGRPGKGYKNPRRLGGATQCLLVNVADVKSHFEHAVKAGAKISDELKETPFGQRRYGAEDPEGHQWYFAQETKKRPQSRKRNGARAARA
jgi:uncharacterized glyoxalase superfamily protein PhnB